jgi:hypothetical protein
MFESKEEIKVAIDALWAVLLKFNRGEIVPWAIVEQHTGPRDENRARYLIRKIRRRLEKEREIVTRCPMEGGIRFLTHQEALADNTRKRKARRQLSRDIKEKKCIDGAALSEHERRLLAFQLERSAKERRAMSQDERLSKTITSPHQSRPLRPVGI